MIDINQKRKVVTSNKMEIPDTTFPMFIIYIFLGYHRPLILDELLLIIVVVTPSGLPGDECKEVCFLVDKVTFLTSIDCRGFVL